MTFQPRPKRREPADYSMHVASAAATNDWIIAVQSWAETSTPSAKMVSTAFETIKKFASMAHWMKGRIRATFEWCLGMAPKILSLAKRRSIFVLT